ncbi:MAG: hypothetical protein IT172_11645 [Acidobacteria bacterium]|nr:hypothetical protein [Acidobacteriota bacterium]
MGEWFGAVFIGLLIIGLVIGLRVLSKPRVSTADEFERRAADGPGTIGVFVNALQDAVDPAAARAKEAVMEMKDGRYQKKKDEGDEAKEPL